MEQNSEPRNKSTHVQSTDLRKVTNNTERGKDGLFNK